ncbi:MAG: hypothetical protein U9Q73_00330 [Nanoarchaeota archaeon]|nr:hypothetical protein [Nanoarchaeota archaeon]
MKRKTSAGFETALTFTSLFGFLVIALNSFTEFNLSPWTTTAFLMLAGVGLAMEGKVLTIRNWARDGIQGPEIPMIFTVVFGIFMIVVGILAMPGVDMLTDQLKGTVGISAILSMAFIALQKWVID